MFEENKNLPIFTVIITAIIWGMAARPSNS